MYSRAPASFTKVGGAGAGELRLAWVNGFDRSKKSSFIAEARGKSLVHTSTIVW